MRDQAGREAFSSVRPGWNGSSSPQVKGGNPDSVFDRKMGTCLWAVALPEWKEPAALGGLGLQASQGPLWGCCYF